MIKLQIKEYCNDCEDFEPVCDKFEVTGVCDTTRKFDTYITCEHINKCALKMEHLKHELERE